MLGCESRAFTLMRPVVFGFSPADTVSVLCATSFAQRRALWQESRNFDIGNFFCIEAIEMLEFKRSAEFSGSEARLFEHPESNTSSPVRSSAVNRIGNVVIGRNALFLLYD